ncbi:SRPBCC domain-containing protein [Microbacterium sp. NPDC057659]|uniref:SRPBCC family protein n=1 Tax=Microbacterium sp. NPDC057659 TaxID=3346198 RepID=UPI00366CFF41
MPDVSHSLEIAARPSAVWRWLETQEGLRRWIGADLEIDLAVGGSYRMTGPDDTAISGRVLELVPEGRLVLSWLEEDAGWEHPGRLVIELRPTEAGTAAALVHDGFAGIGKEDWRGTRDAYQRGIAKHRILEQLAALVEDE